METKITDVVFFEPNIYLLGFAEILEIYDFMFTTAEVQKLCYTYVHVLAHSNFYQSLHNLGGVLLTVCKNKNCKKKKKSV